MVEKLTKAIIATEVVREASRHKCCYGSGLIKLAETSETLEQSMLEGTNSILKARKAQSGHEMHISSWPPDCGTFMQSPSAIILLFY